MLSFMEAVKRDTKGCYQPFILEEEWKIRDTLKSWGISNYLKALEVATNWIDKRGIFRAYVNGNIYSPEDLPIIPEVKDLEERFLGEKIKNDWEIIEVWDFKPLIKPSIEMVGIVTFLIKKGDKRKKIKTSIYGLTPYVDELYLKIK